MTQTTRRVVGKLRAGCTTHFPAEMSVVREIIEEQHLTGTEEQE
jgi:hypothetical protein